MSGAAADVVVLPLSTSGARVAGELPPKARSLQLLWSLGLDVPAAVALLVPSDTSSTALHAACAGNRDAGLLDGLAASVAVRSSAEGEDAEYQAMAGRYESVLDVPNRPGDIAKAVGMVLDSYGGAGRAGCVVVQAYVRPAYGGVLFTEPRANGGGRAVLEWGTDQVGVTAGTSQITHAEVDLDGDKRVPGLPNAVAQKLLDAVGILKPHFPRGMDLEWLVDEQGCTWFVQARPVTVGLQTTAPLVDAVADIDDIGPEQVPDQSNLAKIVASFNVKRRWARLTAKAHGVDHARTWVAFAPNAEGLLRHWNSVRSDIRTDRVTLKTASHDAPLSHAFLPASSVEERVRALGDGTGCEMYVAEYFEPDACGLCGRMDGGGHLIEVVPGDIQALYSGDSQFSTYALDETGAVSNHTLIEHSSAYRLDPALGKAVSVPFGPGTVSLARPVLDDIVHMTNVMCERFGEARVEWLQALGTTVMYDLSVETDALPRFTPGDARVLGEGSASGRVVRVVPDDLAELRNLIKVQRSVVASADESASLAAAEVVAVRDRILGQVEEPVIVVADFPDLSLSVFLDAAAGFVFSAGAILSHFGIIVREARKPAVVTAFAADLQTGDQVWIERGTVHTGPLGGTR